MQPTIQNLQQALLDEHVPSEQVQNIITSVDMSQLNMQDLPATTEYLGQFLGGVGLEQGVIESINTNLAENFGAFGVDNLADLGVEPEGFFGGIIENIKNIFGGFFGGE